MDIIEFANSLSNAKLEALQLQVAQAAAAEMSMKHWRRLQWLQRVFETWAPHLGCASAVVLRRPRLVVLNKATQTIMATGRTPRELLAGVRSELRARMKKSPTEWRTRYALVRLRNEEMTKKLRAKKIASASGGFDEHFELSGMDFEGADFGEFPELTRAPIRGVGRVWIF